MLQTLTAQPNAKSSILSSESQKTLKRMLLAQPSLSGVHGNKCVSACHHNISYVVVVFSISVALITVLSYYTVSSDLSPATTATIC